IAISLVMFVIIQLPPGDYLTTLVAAMASQGEDVDPAALAALKERYGLGQPVYVQYWKWISGIVLRGDFGRSFAWNMPVSDLIWERLALTVVLSLFTLLFVWLVSFPVGVFSAVKQYSPGDYIATFFG
ncbi:MAG: ABC transporter permease, partial [Caldilineaceae bacterium]|nr:ABC transporter permease [Caldilineaceae bacterium]